MEIDIKKDWKFWVILIISSIVILAVAFYKINITNLEYIESYEPSENIEKYNYLYEPMQPGEGIEQSFLAQYDNLSNIYIYFAKLNTKNGSWATGGTATIGIKDSNGNVIYEKIVTRNELNANEKYIFEFPMIKESANKMYSVYINCNTRQEGLEFYRVFYTQDNLYEDGEMYINGEKQSGDMLFQEIYYDDKVLTQLTVVMLSIILVLTIIAIIIYYSPKTDIKKLFWLVIPIIFITFLILMPVFKNHDEAFHWYRIYDMAQGHYLTEVKDGKPSATVKAEVLGIVTLEPETTIDYNFIMKLLKNKLQSENTVDLDLSTTAIYNPIQYIPQTMRCFNNQFNY